MVQGVSSGGPGRGGIRPSQHGKDDRSAGRNHNLSESTIAIEDVRFGDKLDALLFADIAESKAKDIAEAKEHLNKRSQLRRFYDELVMWQEKVRGGDEQFREYEPYIRMMKAKVAYAKGRGYVDANFEALFRRVIDQVTNAKTLHQARLFMEAFMAYYRVYRSS